MAMNKDAITGKFNSIDSSIWVQSECMTYLTNGCLENAHGSAALMDKHGLSYQIDSEYGDNGFYPLTKAEEWFIAQDIMDIADGKLSVNTAYTVLYEGQKFLALESMSHYEQLSEKEGASLQDRLNACNAALLASRVGLIKYIARSDDPAFEHEVRGTVSGEFSTHLLIPLSEVVGRFKDIYHLIGALESKPELEVESEQISTVVNARLVVDTACNETATDLLTKSLSCLKSVGLAGYELLATEAPFQLKHRQGETVEEVLAKSLIFTVAVIDSDYNSYSYTVETSHNLLEMSDDMLRDLLSGYIDLQEGDRIEVDSLADSERIVIS